MAWWIPLLICLARIVDVSIGTIRMILVISGHRWIAAALGFVEVAIWALAIGGMITYLSHPTALLGYAGGFAGGVVVGMWIEERLAIGYRIVRVFNPQPDRSVSAALREHDVRVTRVDGEGRDGPVELAFAVIRRRRLAEVLALVERIAPHAFVTVERADQASDGLVGPGGGIRFGRIPVGRAVVRK